MKLNKIDCHESKMKLMVALSSFHTMLYLCVYIN